MAARARPTYSRSFRRPAAGCDSRHLHVTVGMMHCAVMAASGSTFSTSEPLLGELLAEVRKGVYQLPDFQRGWRTALSEVTSRAPPRQPRARGKRRRQEDSISFSRHVRSLLRADDFDGFIRARAVRLLDLIEDAVGKPIQGRDSDEVASRSAGTSRAKRPRADPARLHRC